MLSAGAIDEQPTSASGRIEDGGKTGVVPPELVHYEPPIYPEAAYQSGVEAVVQLEITIELNGSVSEAQVIEPVGQGFDEAAIAAALQLQFSPALVNGQPRKVKIGYQYSFTIDQPVELPDEPAVAPVAVPGNFEGTILLSGSETPLPGLNVSVVDALGGQYVASTDAEGHFSIEGLPSGVYQVVVAAPGYERVTVEETITGGEATVVTYRLAVEASEGEIVVRGERPPREVTKRTIGRREIERIPGTSGDALRSILSLPGVARPPGLAGFLIVRGSAPQDTQTFVDGSNIPLIYHFGGLSSVVPTELLDRIDFYPGNFSVRYGRVTGGVVDAGFRSPNTDCYGDYGAPTDKKGCFHGMAQIDLIDGRVLLQGPIAKNWSFAVAGRRSYIDTWLRPVLESAGSSVTSAPVYYDYQLIVDHDPRPGEKLSLRFFGSDDRFETIITNPAASDPGFGGNLRYATSFSRGQAVYQKELTKRVSLDAQLSVGTTSIDFGLGGNLKLTINTVPIYMRSEIGYRILDNLRWNVGLDFLAEAFDVFVRAPPPARPGEAASGPFLTRPPRESQASGLGFRPGWYTDFEWQPLERLRVVPGLRLDYATDSGHADLSPRLNFRYSLFLPEDEAFFGLPRKTILKGGLGKFSQPPQFQETDPVFGTPGLRSNDSYHYSLGVEQGLTDQVELSVEGFYKDLRNFVSRGPNDLGIFTYGNQGRGEVVGLETLLRYNPDERFFGWVAYTLSRSTRADCSTCEPYLFQYDQTHNLILLGSYRLGRGWEIGARFRIVSGPLATPPVASPALPSIFAGDAGSYVPIQGVPYSSRMPLFHQLDVRIDKRWQFRTWRLNAYLDIQNVYNHAATEGLVYNFDYSQSAYQTGLPILPSLGLRGEF